jgi:hypothetical protein
MSIVTRVTLVVSAATLMVTGCDDVRGDACGCEDEVSVREVHINGTWLNGTWLNGTWLNGTWLNGTWLNGTWLNGTRLSAPGGDYVQPLALDLPGNNQVQSVWLDGSQLKVTTTQGETLAGSALDNMVIEFEVQEGGVVNKKKKGIVIRGVKQLAGNPDVWLYSLDVKIGQGGWQPLCTDKNGIPTEAILLGDVWDGATGARQSPRGDGALTFACRDYALAKCVEFGYKPWASVNGTSLSEHHQACARMLRADYCGDGVSHTSDGTPVHVQDALGIQKLDPNATFAIEAEWGPNGATCLNPNNLRLGAQSLSCQLPTCGATYSSGGLIQSGKIVAGP